MVVSTLEVGVDMDHRRLLGGMEDHRQVRLLLVGGMDHRRVRLPGRITYRRDLLLGSMDHKPHHMDMEAWEDSFLLAIM